MPGPVFLPGDSVDLRTVEDEVVAFLRDGVTDPSVRPYAGDEIPYSRDRYVEERLAPVEAGDALNLLVGGGDDRAGAVSLGPIDDRRGWANLGYWIHPDHQGNGYATEAARLVVTHGFDALGLHRLSATIEADNVASRRVVARLGFTHEGTKRDDAFADGEYVDREIYGVLAAEWPP